MSVCYDASGIPIPCTGWSVHDSYVTDPRYQRYFTLAWICTFALAFLLTAPALVRTLATADWRRPLGSSAGLFGVHEGTRRGYAPLSTDRERAKTATLGRKSPGALRRPFLAVAALVRSASLFTIPLPSAFARLPSIPLLRPRQTPSCYPTRTYLPFSLGKLVVALLIPAFLLATLFPESQLRADPNRFGFLAIACLPPIFLLSTKNGPVGWLLGRGWTCVNFLHRWLGRAVVLLVLLHFYFWTVQYAGSAQTTFLAGEKERRGIAALAFLLLILVSSLPPMRRFSYPIFFTLHYVGLVGFLVFLQKHTIYARAYSTWPVIAIYTADILGRVLSMRIRVVEAEALHGGMVKLALPGLRAGWRGGQHLSVRIFFVPPPLVHTQSTGSVARFARDVAHGLRSAVRPFEAHPLSIATAPAELAADAGVGVERGIELYARSCGPRTWSDDLHRYVSAAVVAPARKTRLLCLIEGPYGGLPAYTAPLALLEETESLLLVAGGSGMSFVLGVLDELVGRRLSARTTKSGRVDVVWVVRQRTHVAWFAERLHAILAAAEGSAVRVVLRVFVTCDETLTAAVDAPSAVSSSDQSGSANAPPPPLLPAHASLTYTRPALGALVRETLDRALAPCGTCFPVCKCGDLPGAAGECANHEEECVGGCGGVASGTELLEKSAGEGDREEKEDEVGEVPVLPSAGGCCAKRRSPSRIDDEIHELPAVPSSCCAPAPAVSSPPAPALSCGGCCAHTTGGGCCTGTIEGARGADGDADERDRVAGRPLRVRTGGMGVVVCGPGNMVAELRNAVAAIPIAKQVRVGGVSVHVEQYSV